MNIVGLQQISGGLAHHLILAGQHLPSLGIHHILHRIATAQTLTKGLNDLAMFTDLADHNTVMSPTVMLPNNDLLGHIYQAAGQIA